MFECIPAIISLLHYSGVALTLIVFVDSGVVFPYQANPHLHDSWVCLQVYIVDPI